MSKKQETLTITSLEPVEQPVAIAAKGSGNFLEKIDAMQPLGFTAEQFLAVSEYAQHMSASDLMRISIPTGGMTKWVIPDPEAPNGKTYEDEIVGVIVGALDARSLWLSNEETKKVKRKLPLCKSGNGKTGQFQAEDIIQIEQQLGRDIKMPTGDCANCPHSQFGGDCKPKKRLFIVRDGEKLPSIVSLSKMSIPGFKQYAAALLTKGIPFSSRRVKLALGEAISKEVNQPYAVAKITTVGEVSNDEKEFLAFYVAAIKNLIADPYTNFSGDDEYEAEME